ncbi:acyltransferase [Corynebacterium sp.]|uniref:acyltransferase family protein n=1 Tax=Corynebacterium sp. TaxID=1720 RepID=UPI0026DAB07A|nr:acyltransferase [Corynebacterium sp.]MDO5033187.1 acyltransferase [Corynebacterium sp.]
MAPQRAPSFLPELEGLRAVASLGIVVTHVSFQTGTGWGWAERFDYFVAVFFALSAFLLWRRRHVHTAAGYAFSRVVRLVPAYLVCVLVVFALLPDAHSATLPQILATVTGTQIYIADGLAPGLTQLWSLCVEFAFYVALPFLAWGLDRFSGRVRMLLIAAGGLLSLGWGFVPFVADYHSGDVNSQIWPPAYASWFAVGMLAAEVEQAWAQGWLRRPRWAQRLLGARWLWWLAAAGSVWLASREFFGPRGLVHPEPGEFARRIALGALFGACVMVPVALAPHTSQRGSWLSSPTMQALGRWSYGIFLWHVAVLSVVFPLLGVRMFSGGVVDFLTVLLATSVISAAVAAASYALVEKPARRALRPWRPSGRHRQAKAAPHRAASSQESPA